MPQQDLVQVLRAGLVNENNSLNNLQICSPEGIFKNEVLHIHPLEVQILTLLLDYEELYSFLDSLNQGYFY
jgi:hypothetical protein